MRRIILADFALPLLLLSPQLVAASCEEPDTQMEMNVCAQNEFERSDKALNAEYRTYRDGLSESAKALLMSAQSLWVSFRDASCKFESSAVEGGSMQPMVYSMCLTDYTQERRKRIAALAECKLMPNPGKDCAG